jgi:hypothetical protein
MLAALPPEFLSLPREVVHLRAVTAKLSDLAGLDWASARRAQAEEVRTRLEILINSHPAWRIQYFGAAPIPLAMDLGCLIGGWTAVDVYQQRHDTNSWSWPRAERTSKVQFNRMELPQEHITAEGDVVIRVSVSHAIDPSETSAVVPNSLGQVDIALQSPDEDALDSAADLEALKKQFDKAIDWAHAARPNAELHLFAAVTVGAAFRLGMEVNPTIHSPIHTYQYSNGSSPRYERALILQRTVVQIEPLSPKQVTEAAGLRAQIREELDAIRAAAARLLSRDQSNARQSWLKTALPTTPTECFHGPIRTLATIFETPLAESSVDLITMSVPDSFCYDPPSRMWRFDDRFLATLARQFPDPKDRRQAGRQLLLHEGVHQKTHGLTEATSRQVRRFPKIVEELDYQQTFGRFFTTTQSKLLARAHPTPQRGHSSSTW